MAKCCRKAVLSELAGRACRLGQDPLPAFSGACLTVSCEGARLVNWRFGPRIARSQPARCAYSWLPASRRPSAHSARGRHTFEWRAAVLESAVSAPRPDSRSNAGLSQRCGMGSSRYSHIRMEAKRKALEAIVSKPALRGQHMDHSAGRERQGNSEQYRPWRRDGDGRPELRRIQNCLAFRSPLPRGPSARADRIRGISRETFSPFTVPPSSWHTPE